eukprot:TRINITY_DN1828_c0_g1_i1.p1 TRINITY_DN1828_c0_g1~~TRINITY_DN1828_c0_g1_i1.p1  ORF type:complete len:248 (+),score=52.58 TRINITY_DN1828_c0_g1_i1:187-930(+)
MDEEGADNVFMRMPAGADSSPSKQAGGNVGFVESGGLAVNVPTSSATSEFHCPAPHPPSAADDIHPDLEDGGNDIPLLEELGIDFHHLRVKAFQLLQPWAHKNTVPHDDADLAGPVFSAVALGAALLLTGRVHFGYIYGCGVVGCLAVFALLNLMVQSRRKVDLAFVVSTLGYCLMPHIPLALLSMVRLVVAPPLVLSAVTAVAVIVWETWAATERFVVSVQMRDQRWLVAYPLALFYSVFTLISVF